MLYRIFDGLCSQLRKSKTLNSFIFITGFTMLPAFFYLVTVAQKQVTVLPQLFFWTASLGVLALFIFAMGATGVVAGEEMAIEELGADGQDLGGRRFLHLQAGCARCEGLNIKPQEINCKNHPVDECPVYQAEFQHR